MVSKIALRFAKVDRIIKKSIYLSVADKLGEDALSRAALELSLGAAPLDISVGLRPGSGEGEGRRVVQLLEWPQAGK